MRKMLLIITVVLVFNKMNTQAQSTTESPNNPQFTTLLDSFYEVNARINPIRATFLGDTHYTDLLPIDFTDSYRAASKQTFQRFLTSLHQFNRERLSVDDKISYDVLQRQLSMNIRGWSLPTNLLVFNQFNGLPIDLPLLGSGSSAQPFKTITDYDNWLRRVSVFAAWSDSAILYFKKGMAAGIVLPKPLVEKMIPQMAAQISSDPTKSIFYGPIKNIPVSFSNADKKRLTDAFTLLIAKQINPAYQKLHDFLQTEYLPKARSTSGYNALPNGAELYNYAIQFYTTTTVTADQVFKLGLAEVDRIHNEMERVKNQIGFKGDMKALFAYMRTDAKFYPYKTPEEILSYYRGIQQKIEPALKTMFNHFPKTPFEIRQTEAFRAATAAAQYFPGSLENNRPGIFYVPIVDATKTQTRESLFLHEAIPGHHFQLSLQNENTNIPKFRRYNIISAYAEGWGLYAESLGKELGMYQDPYQYMLALGDEIHRAIRLVVDAGLHAKGWTREQAIQYSLDNEPIEEQRAVAEVERYMAWPGQALAYKIGALKIQELRTKYAKQLGSAFNLAAFHDAILMDGALPLGVLESKMDAWAKQQKK